MSSATASLLDSTSSRLATRVRFDYLDGLRGLAALYVTCHHALQVLAWNNYGHLSPGLLMIVNRFVWGHATVDVFIVLSGFCLMLPVARPGHGNLSGGALGFLKRRARRILPPYYVALALSLVLIVCIPALNRMSQSTWDLALPALRPGVLLSHLLLLQNLKEDWLFKIDPPMWSVATEWQIYFLFPPLLLLWKRWGIWSVLITCIILGLMPHFLLHRFDGACPWFLGLFGLGMTGAVISLSSQPQIALLRARLPWNGIAGMGALLFCLLAQLAFPPPLYATDLLAGTATLCLLIGCACQSQASLTAKPPVLRLLESRGPVTLGIFSYSLYLVHFPILAILFLGFRHLGFNPHILLVILVFVAVPVCVLASYGFHLAFERPFMPGRPRSQKRAVESAIISPAP